MKIVVFVVAAERGGALSVLLAAHSAALRAEEHDWVFVASEPELSGSSHLRARRFPWIKRGWLHRLWFDLVVAPEIVKQEKPDVVVSLQNVTTPRVRQRQIVYLHTALPFSSYRFRLGKNPKLWLYQQLVTRRILSSVRKADKIVVQAPWMKRAVIEKMRIDPTRLEVIRPTVASQTPIERYRPTAAHRRRFFYPAAALPYKNHELIFAAAEQLLRAGIEVEVACTISASDLARIGITHVPSNVHLLGRIPFDEVQRRYRESVLVFPSVLETVGLPLVEAQAWQTFVLAADLPYASDALAGYDNAYYFDPADPNRLASLMTSVADGSMPHSGTPAPRALEGLDPWDEFFRLVASQ